MKTVAEVIQSAIAAGFSTQAEKKRLAGELSRRYGRLRESIMQALLAERDRSGRAEVDPLYYDLPFELHQWRASKHADPRFAAENEQIAKLAGLRHLLKAAPVVKASSQRDARPVVDVRDQLRGACSACGRLQAIDEAGRVADHGYQVHWHQHMGRCSGSRVPHFGTEAGRDWLAESVAGWESRADSLQLQLPDAEDDKSRREMRRRIDGLRAAAADGRKRIAAWQPAAPVVARVEQRETYVHLSALSYGVAAAACCASAMGARKFRGQTTTVEADVTCPRCLKRLEARALKGGGA